MALQVPPQTSLAYGLGPILIDSGSREGYPGTMVRLVERCLEVEAADRIPAAHDLAQPLKEAVTSCGFGDLPMT
ncbi:hypothetical protein Tdes44962_MAKER07686 [Teratosphaeria destructans]|uniref:Uncharacterized protein n=1 Tax=Teratosphaeria destructans TaxID=418781 RepID=A0A9W7W5L9_9PEZI|nr:hypothetical protein Tdes44962_MAKER07686 [Teratosphaeria destructans]